MGLLAYWRIGVGIVLAIVLAFAGITITRWHHKAQRVDAAEARTAEIAKQAGDAMAALAEAHRKALNASQGLQDELSKLRANRKPSRVVRLCNDVPAHSTKDGSAGRRDGPTPGAGELPKEAGQDSRDIGPDLYGLADDADELAARLRACQKLLQ